MEIQAFRLFILGAGFSRPAGLPLGPELLEEVRKRLRRRFKDSADWEGPLEREILEWQQLDPNRDLNLESVFAYSHRKHYLRLIGSNETWDHGSESIVEARRMIQDILTERTTAETPTLYSDFASRLTSHDTVLTFNYDTLLEQALDDGGQPYSLTPEWWLEEEPSRHYSALYIDLIKLHGSIDWYDRVHYDRSRRYYSTLATTVPDDDPLFGAHRTIPTETLSRGTVQGENGKELLQRVVRVPNHRGHFPFARHGDVVPFLLPPAHDKLLGSDPIRDLWENMHRTLDAFSVVVVIGYSMPAYDEYAYETIGRLIVEYQSRTSDTHFGHRRVPVQFVTKAQCEESVLEAIPFLAPEKTRIWHKGFDQKSLAWLDWGDPPREWP